MSEKIKNSAWEKLKIIREKNRPTVKDYLPLLFDDFFELHGDRLYGDDAAIIGGVGLFDGVPVTVISQVKGRNLAENKAGNFAMPHPEGYRKALRLARQAEKFHRPVICFIDTPGAFCGIEAEKRGQGEAIARNLFEFITLKTPVISVVLGEGGSGGALALGICDRLGVLENSIYSVISPRGAASILWKDAGKEKDAAEVLKITATDMLNFGIAEKIIPEPPGGAHTDTKRTANAITDFLSESINLLKQADIDNLLEKRYLKFRNLGVYAE
ncbi:MAG: acetyl-CoA carboxylase carboxyltransferase subunit alpha [Ruminococcus sp.]|jgi:acetyl-CoA carboxylase carboxyl transferase subunit alpha|nr:acetyl-CoA carboxylase carboxyltransferase subunit alpha [Ruminococcus sp.]